MRLVDLSLTIQPHWRWAVEQKHALSHSAGDPFQSTVLTLPMHGFTHVDTPLHIKPGEITINEVPLESLAGPAVIFDLTYVDKNQKICRNDLEQFSDHLQEGDIVLLKTDWDRKRNPASREYWSEAPYVDAQAASWLAKQPIKAVGFDFPQDYAIREIPNRHPNPDEMPTHDSILRKGIYLIEYLCNLSQIEKQRFTFFAVPLKVGNAEGAPTRAFGILDA